MRCRSAAIGVAAALVSGSSAAAAPACRAVSFPVEVKAGDSFAREIGGGLVLRLMPEAYADPRDRGKRLDGWQVVVVPAQGAAGAPAADRIWPANPPLRFNPWQDIGTTYGLTAAEKLSRDIAYRFLWRAAEYEKLAALASDALWPYSAPDPDNASALYLAALKKFDAATIQLHPVRFELAENGLGIRRLVLVVTITAPEDFAFPASPTPAPASCPPPAE